MYMFWSSFSFKHCMKIAGLMALFGRKRSCSEDKEHNKRNNRIYNSVHDTQRPLLVLTIKKENFPTILQLVFKTRNDHIRFLLWHCRVEQNLTSKKFPEETKGAISTSATRWFENWSYFHFWLASKREAQYLSLEMSYSKNFKNGNFLHLMTQLLIIHNFFQNSAHQVKKLGFRRPQKNLFFGLFSTFSIANIKSCQ